MGITIEEYLFADELIFPNNVASGRPLLLYRNAVELPPDNPAPVIERLFERNSWSGNIWRSGVYDYHHYHATAHEVLGCFSGSATLRFGGDEAGKELPFAKGDVVVIPAGVAHKCVRQSADFAVIGAYPANAPNADMNYGNHHERPEADQHIAAVPRPQKDPVMGEDGPLLSRWSA